MNKTQLVDALAARIGDRRTAASAVDGLLETIVTTVGTGESVSLTGFGVFESRPRAARVARNPRTGDTVDVPATTVPAFRPGAGFRSAVGGSPVAPPQRNEGAVAPSAASLEPEVASNQGSAAIAAAQTRARAAATFSTDTGKGTSEQAKKGKKAAKTADTAEKPRKKAKAGKATASDEKPGKGKKTKSKK